MYIQKTSRTHKGKTYRCVRLCESKWVNGNSTTVTIANLSKFPSSLIKAMESCLAKEKSPKGKGRGNIQSVDLDKGLSFFGAKSFGAISSLFLLLKETPLYSLLRKVGAYWLPFVIVMIISRCMSPGSKLSTSKWATGKGAAIIGLLNVDKKEISDVDNYYDCMDVLLEHQERIQHGLLKKHLVDETMILYDITSSYFEGEKAELGAFGYNRDGKKGKKQVVIGLVCSKEGRPLSIEVFPGNTNDSSTVEGKVKELRGKYGVKDAIFVGDRGMIKSSNIPTLIDEGFDYITAVTKRDIRNLLEKEFSYDSLFSEELGEIVQPDEKVRYIGCYNPVLAIEEKETRDKLLEKTEAFLKNIQKQIANKRLKKKELIFKRVYRKINHWNQEKFFALNIEEGVFEFSRKNAEIKEEQKLDGRYVIKTSVKQEKMSKKDVVESYKRLQKVEQAFRLMKTVQLEVRPIYHHREKRIRSHAFICLLASYLLFEFNQRVKGFKEECNGKGKNRLWTTKSIIDELNEIQLGKIRVGTTLIKKVSEINKKQKKILGYLGLRKKMNLMATKT